MVISSSNRSPSPMSTRPNPNPNPNPNSRTHQEREGIAPARKSFSGYPIAKPSLISQPRSFISNTPANSPAEYARRSSFSKDSEQKENERDPNSKPIARTRSPSVLKGKNFMSPTISAASKINASPRKKVLGERNEAIRTSASLSDGKFHFFSTSSLEFADDNEPKADLEQPPCLITSDFDNNKVGNEINVAGFSPGEGKIESESDMVVLSPEIPPNTTKSSESFPLSEMPKTVDCTDVSLGIKNSFYSSPTVIASLDSDPSLPPYDPKKNYLSPRPQFLHYKPNPRIESYINQGVRLEDEFASESFSETENSGETESEDSQKEQEDSSSSFSSSSVSMPSADEKPPSYAVETQQLEETVEAKIEHKPWFLTKWKAVAFLLVIMLGFISFSVIHSPSIGNAMYRDEIISRIYSDPRVVGDLAKANLHDLLQNAQLWSAYYVDHLSHMILNLREVHEFSSLPLSNLTGWHEEKDGDYEVEELELGSFFERKGGVPEIAMDESAGSCTKMQTYPEHEPVAEETQVIKLDDSDSGKVEDHSVFLPLTDHVSHQIADHNNDPLNEAKDLSVHNEPEIQQPDNSADHSSNPVNGAEVGEAYIIEQPLIDEPEYQEPDHTTDHSREPLIEAEDQGTHIIEESIIDETSNQEADHTQEENHFSFSVHDEGQWSVSSSQGPEVYPQGLAASEPLAEDELNSCVNVESDETEETKAVSERLNPEVTAEASEISLASITAAVSSVIVSLVAAGTFIYRRQRKDNSVISAPLADQLVKKEKSLSESRPSWSGPVEVDMVGESCPSEMSSFQNISSNNKRGPRDLDEAQSIEKRFKRNYKRESLASSSSEFTMGSSYGSFTTYSIIPAKHGADHEVVTPVRRSSRIRKHVISP